MTRTQIREPNRFQETVKSDRPPDLIFQAGCLLYSLYGPSVVLSIQEKLEQLEFGEERAAWEEIYTCVIEIDKISPNDASERVGG